MYIEYDFISCKLAYFYSHCSNTIRTVATYSLWKVYIVVVCIKILVLAASTIDIGTDCTLVMYIQNQK
jgi:hypothetical protein